MLYGAAEDIEKKGIACTRDLESGLRDELNRTGLAVMKTLLKSEAAVNAATTDRVGNFGRLVCAEFDRRFGFIPETTLFIADGGKWPLRTLLKSERIEEFFRCRVAELPQVRFAV